MTIHKRNIFTIGHSTRTAQEFLKILQAYKIEEVVDIRTIPKSRHNPQFNKENISEFLGKNKIGYVNLKELGGLRRADKNSVNLGWRNSSFRGFADYMQTADFKKGLKILMKMAREKITAIMCAEAVPWRCHRSLVADALVKNKWDVFHIQSLKTANKHKLTPFLRVKKGKIIYPSTRETDAVRQRRNGKPPSFAAG